MSTVRAEVAGALRKIGQQDSTFQSAPAAVFWPDPDHAWQTVVDRLREAVPLLTLGDYQPDAAQGPAVWIRAVVAEPSAPSVQLTDQLARPDDRRPWVIYLPGRRRDDFSDLAQLDAELAPLADLELRARWWLQSNQQPWSPQAFLRSRDGLGLDFARDDATRAAVTNVLPTLIDQTVESLRRGPRWDAARLNTLLVPDEVSKILRWLDDPARIRAELTATGSWSAFAGICRDAYEFDPDRHTQIDAAHQLRRREGPWRQVWERFAEAPDRYPRIPDALDRATPELLFDDDPYPDSRPDWNAEKERELRTALVGLNDIDSARQTIAELEGAHGARRDAVWARLGLAPLAKALHWLSTLAESLTQPPANTNLPAIIQWYADHGYRIDDYALQAIAAAPAAVDRSAVLNALALLYDPWLAELAGSFQRAAVHGGYRGATGLEVEQSTCVVFVDGLRLDLGHRLAAILTESTLQTSLTHRLAAFPTVTPSGQPAVAPLTAPIGTGPGMAAGDSEGRPMTGAVFRRALAAAGVTYLAAGHRGDPTGVAWTQSNDIDALGHDHHHKLADQLDHELDLIADQIESLLSAGWRRVVVVTDHGFLLPARPAAKVELPLHLTEGDAARKPRAARLKSGQTTDYPTLPWTWDETVTMVSAPRADAFVAGTLYEHGGLSPQECVIPVITVVRTTTVQDAKIEGLRWTGQRCRIDVAPTNADVLVEIRKASGDPNSRVGQPKQPLDGEAKILVSEEEAAEGLPVVVVLLNVAGTVIHQKSTTVGETQ